MVRVSDLVVLLFHEDLIDDFSGPKLIFTLHAECFAESFGGGGGGGGVNTILPALSTFWKGFGCPGWVLKVVCFSFCWRCRKEKKMKKKKVEKEKEKVRKRCKRSELETELVIQEPFTCLEKVARKRGDK